MFFPTKSLKKSGALNSKHATKANLTFFQPVLMWTMGINADLKKSKAQRAVFAQTNLQLMTWDIHEVRTAKVFCHSSGDAAHFADAKRRSDRVAILNRNTSKKKLQWATKHIKNHANIPAQQHMKQENWNLTENKQKTRDILRNVWSSLPR